MENQRRVMCPENEDLASFMWKMSQEMADPKGISERTDATLYKAYCKVCSSKTPIKTLKEFSQIKGVGKWTLRLLQGFFKTDSNNSESEEQSQKGKKIKGTKRYVPQKNSVAYALLITLYRSTVNGSAFMRKQELIDAAEESGLSRVPIAPELGQGKRGRFGSSPREWYSGWNCMKTLITKGLVVRSSNPAKYMLTQEGKEAVMGCLSRSGLVDCTAHLDTIKRFPSQDVQYSSDLTFALTNLVEQKVTLTSVEVSSQGKSVGAPIEFLEKFTHMGYSEMQIQIAFAKVSQATQNKETSSIWSAVLHHLRKDQVDAMLSECGQALGKDSLATSTTSTFKEVGRADFVEENNQHEFPCGGAQCDSDSSYFADSAQSSFILQACSSSDYSKQKSLNSDGVDTNMNAVMMPPLNFGERFVDVYDVILILDDREQFAKNNKGYRSRKIIENICTEFKIQIEVRRLAIGDGIWIARHKHLEIEYVLDFIVERKEVDDLRSSIRDNRYRDQKLRLLRCGLQKLIYVVEGDPNSSEAAESIKTACFTTEILEEFDVQRTGGLGDTLRKYGFLTQAIIRYYSTQISTDRIKSSRICPSFEDFTKKCQDLEKVTVSDVFAVQLMQVPQVTEEIALAVRNLYPTLFSLAHAYSRLEGDVNAQEDMLKKLSNNLISGVASRNIFRLVWGCWKD